MPTRRVRTRKTRSRRRGYSTKSSPVRKQGGAAVGSVPSHTPGSAYRNMLEYQSILGQIRAIAQSGAEPGSALKEMRRVLLPGRGPNIRVVVDKINPSTAWPNSAVKVDVTVINNTGQETSGTVTADLLQDGFDTVLSSGFGVGGGAGEGAAAVTSLGPGQKTSVGVVLKTWRTDPAFLKVGMQELLLQYWIVVAADDPRGTITLYNPFTKTATTLAPISTKWGSLELYPQCQAVLPKFAAQSDYLKIESFQFVGASTVYKDVQDSLTEPFQSVGISWDVRSGGFPPVDDHPGSLSSVTLTGPNLGNGITLGPAGQQSFQMGGIQQLEAAKPFVLTAVGNCGKAQASLSAQIIYRPPVIESFTVTPNDNDPKTGYVALGKPAMLSWKFAGLNYKDGVSIVGTDGQGNPVFNAKGITSYSIQVNSLQVVPSSNTRYSLQIIGPGGSASDSLWVDVYNSKQDNGSWFYFQMTNDESDILPCFMLAIFAPDAASAKSLAEAENGGYSAQQVDVNAYLAGCQ